MWNQGIRAHDASANVLARRLVIIAALGTVAHCTANGNPDGVTEYAAKSGNRVGVKPLNMPGSFEMTADGAIAAGSDVYPGADGKISATVVPGRKIGKLLEAATADGDIVEVLPNSSGDDATAADAVQTLTDAAPVIIPGTANKIDSTANAVAATLAADTVVGRFTTIVMEEASNASTVTIANHETSDPEVVTFDAVDEVLILMWTGTEYMTVKATATFV